MLRARWPAAAIEEWDPRERGNPESALRAGGYAAVLMYVEPTAGDGLAWMAGMLREAAAPPCVPQDAQVGEHFDAERFSRMVK